MDIITEWLSKSEYQQINLVTACVKSAVKHEFTINSALGAFFIRHELDELINDTWIKLCDRLTPDYLNTLNARRQSNGNAPITLISLIYRTSRCVINSAKRHDKRDKQITAESWIDDNDVEHNLIDDIAAPYSMESEVLTDLIIGHITSCVSSTDRTIIERMVNGYTQVEIASQLKISAPAICKHVKQIRVLARAAAIA